MNNKKEHLNISCLQDKAVLNSDFINLCFASSNEYAQHLSVALKSIFSNKKQEEKFNITILENNISEKNKRWIKSIIDENSTVRFVKIDDEFIRRNCILRADIPHINSLSTYYRFLLADIITESKVLYLDCDVIVNKSLGELFNTDISECYIAGVRDSYEIENCQRLNLTQYVNAGVLLINSDLWRKDNISQKLLELSYENQKEILWLDQDVINIVLQGKIKYLNNLYNAQVSELKFGLTKDFNKIADKAVIIHYVGYKKPWQNNHFILSRYYYKYLLKTKFAYKYFLLLLSEIFSIKEEISGVKTYRVIRVLGLKLKLRKEKR